MLHRVTLILVSVQTTGRVLYLDTNVLTVNMPFFKKKKQNYNFYGTNEVNVCKTVHASVWTHLLYVKEIHLIIK